MAYYAVLEIEAGQTREDPATTFLELAYGTIEVVLVQFPPGHAGLTRIQMYYNETQAFPRNPGEFYIGDDTVLSIPTRYPIHERPWRLELVGWAPDAELPHNIHVEIALIEEALYLGPTTGPIALPEGV